MEKLVYIPGFYTRGDADELFEFAKTLTNARYKNAMDGGKSNVRRLAFPGYTITWDEYQAGAATIESAPPLYQKLATRLMAHAGRSTAYLSTVGYLVDDHMAAHQHDEDRVKRDQTVWVLSLGAVHPVKITSGSTRPVANKKTGHISQKFVPDGGYEIIYPAHGSLYVLPSSFNEIGNGNEHQHAVLPGDDYSHGGLRISINSKHLEPGLPRAFYDKICTRPAGRTQPHTSELFVREPGGSRIYDCHSGKRWPEAAVYVGREVRSRQMGEVDWPWTPYGNHKKLNGQEWIDETNRLMADSEFAAKMRNDLRDKDLLCWCPPDEPNCHARRWLQLANE